MKVGSPGPAQASSAAKDEDVAVVGLELGDRAAGPALRRVAWGLAELAAQLVDLLFQLNHAQLPAHHGVVKAGQLFVGLTQFSRALPY